MLTPTKIEAARAFVLAMLRDAAAAGLRCPANHEIRAAAYAHGLTFPIECYPSELAYAGRIRVEVYARNWRVVEIDGLRTMEPPRGGEPYKVIGPAQGAPR